MVQCSSFSVCSSPHQRLMIITLSAYNMPIDLFESIMSQTHCRTSTPSSCKPPLTRYNLCNEDIHCDASSVEGVCHDAFSFFQIRVLFLQFFSSSLLFLLSWHLIDYNNLPMKQRKLKKKILFFPLKTKYSDSKREFLLPLSYSFVQCVG